ncbi:hypothetical protein [Streptomyces griseus]|uniref:hypothetical protein n=1 Tax=Streptomyces griseus TaxID=1911 RepID=UPI001F2E4482|nr:hypothetical protein [Streptomyces griseus]
MNETSPGMAAVARDLAKAIDATDAPTAKAVAAREAVRADVTAHPFDAQTDSPGP